MALPKERFPGVNGGLDSRFAALATQGIEGEHAFDLSAVVPPRRDAAADRRAAIEQWRCAPAEFGPYKGGSYPAPDGTTITYPKGENLVILGRDIMSTSENPWARATVYRAFEDVLKYKSRDIRVFERGFGLGLTAGHVMHFLRFYGGTYDCVELNKDVAKRARAWRDHQNQGRQLVYAGLPGIPPRLPIRIYEGEAAIATAKRARLIAAGEEEPADIIISDTFPLTEDEVGINDLKDLEILKQCLAPDGVFTFYAWFPGKPEGFFHEHRDLLAEHFGDYQYFEIPNRQFPEPVAPPPSYKYLYTKEGPIRKLPVVICKDPK